MATMDEYFKKGEVYKNQSGSTVKIDWYDKNGEVQYTHNKQSQSATEKGLKNMLERNGYKKVNDIAMEYDPIACMMVPAKDQRTVDFSSSDARDVFKDIDKYFQKSLGDIVRKIEAAKTPEECEKLENQARKDMEDIMDEYLQIWNMVGLYAQHARNDVSSSYKGVMGAAYKRYNALSGK